MTTDRTQDQDQDPPREDGAACLHERSHIIDSRFFQQGYSTPESREILCDVCRIGRWLTVEGALAQSQAELGLIPEWAGSRIVAVCQIGNIDLDRVRRGIAETGHSLVPLLRQLTDVCGDALDFVHFGATTQDIQDSAQAMEMRDVLRAVAGRMDTMRTSLVHLAERHRATLMTGRTHAQPALPITFGLKVATWVDELLRHGARVQETRARVVVAQLFGGVGTMAAFGPKGIALLRRFAARLGLGVPLVAWHAARDRVAEYVNTLALLTATLARIADEIRTLSRPEIGEVEERWRMGQVGSSTMPHKRNPERCEQVVVLARLARAQVGLALEAMVVEHERDYRATRIEWCAVADVSHYALAALTLLQETIDDLEVHAGRMAAAVLRFGDDLCTEALMMAVARDQGRERAHRLIYAISQTARSACIPLRQAARENEELAGVLTPEALDGLLDPRRYVGLAETLVDQVVEAARTSLGRNDQDQSDLSGLAR